MRAKWREGSECVCERLWARWGQVYACVWSGRFLFFYVEGQIWDSLQILSELCRRLTLFHPLSFTVPCSCPLETRWRDDQEAASVKTANQYGSSVWDETLRLHWKKQKKITNSKRLFQTTFSTLNIQVWPKPGKTGKPGNRPILTTWCCAYGVFPS